MKLTAKLQELDHVIKRAKESARITKHKRAIRRHELFSYGCRGPLWQHGIPRTHPVPAGVFWQRACVNHQIAGNAVRALCWARAQLTPNANNTDATQGVPTHPNPMSKTALRLEMHRLAAMADKSHAKGKAFTGEKLRHPRQKNSGWIVKRGTPDLQPQTRKP